MRQCLALGAGLVLAALAGFADAQSYIIVAERASPEHLDPNDRAFGGVYHGIQKGQERVNFLFERTKQPLPDIDINTGFDPDRPQSDLYAQAVEDGHDVVILLSAAAHVAQDPYTVLTDLHVSIAFDFVDPVSGDSLYSDVVDRTPVPITGCSRDTDSPCYTSFLSEQLTSAAADIMWRDMLGGFLLAADQDP